MSVSSVGVDEGTTKYFHTDQRTIASVAREDQYVQFGEPAYATYSAIVSGISAATSGAHLLVIQADGTAYTRLERVYIEPAALPAAATAVRFSIIRTATAGTGGTAVTPRGFDPADSAFGGSSFYTPTSKGTEGAVVWSRSYSIGTAFPVDASWSHPFFEATERDKPIIFGTGTGAGVAIAVVTGIASLTVNIVAEFRQTLYL